MGQSDEQVVRGWRAWGWRASAALVCGGLVSFGVLAPAHADLELTPGSAAATATVAGLNIPYSGANIGVDVGLANASFFEQDAKASAVTLEPGFLRIANVLKVCGGLPIDFPAATTADTNRIPSTSTGHHEYGPGLGVEDTRAEPGSHSHAAVTAGTFGIPGIVELRGGEAEAETRLDQPGRSRVARSEVRTGSVVLAGGLVELRGLRWTLEQRAVGLDSRTLEANRTAEFSIGAVTLAGLPLPAGSGKELESTIATVNQALAPLSIELRLPALRSNGDRGAELTSLTVAIGGNPTFGPQLYALLAGPDATSLVNLLNSTTQPAILDPSKCTAIFGLLKDIPEAGALLNTLGIYGPVILSAAAAAFNGGAELNLNVGGVRTTYDATYYTPRAAPAVATTAVTRSSGTPGAVPTVPAPGAPAVEEAGAPLRTSSRCSTTSPVGRPGCSKGRAPLAATAAAVLTGGLLATDELGRRRRQRHRSIERAT